MATKEMDAIDNFSDKDGSDDADIDLTDISEQQNTTSAASKEQIQSKEVSTNCNLITDDPSNSSKDVEGNVNVSTTPTGTDDDNMPEPQISEGETRYYNLHFEVSASPELVIHI